MRAIHQRVIGQGGQLAERADHLRRRAFKQAAAAAGKQRVAAEQPGRAILALAHVGDVAHGVARHIQHIQLQRQTRHFDLAFATGK
jgi:hypothetical protein